MAIQFLPFIKALAPYIAQIATAAIPAFTSKSEAAILDPVLAKQIEELQSAVTQNAKSIHLLAEKMQQVIEGIEAAALDAKNQIRTYKTMIYLSFALSIASFSACVYLVMK